MARAKKVSPRCRKSPKTQPSVQRPWGSSSTVVVMRSKQRPPRWTWLQGQPPLSHPEWRQHRTPWASKAPGHFLDLPGGSAGEGNPRISECGDYRGPRQLASAGWRAQESPGNVLRLLREPCWALTREGQSPQLTPAWNSPALCSHSEKAPQGRDLGQKTCQILPRLWGQLNPTVAARDHT